MREILNLPIVGDLLTVFALLLCIFGLIKVIMRIPGELQSKGWKGIIDEVIITIIIIAIVASMVFGDGLVTILDIIGKIWGWIVDGFDQIVEYVTN